MKFRFCGDGDCPDWVLGEIVSTLSCLTSIKFRILASQVAKNISGDLDELPEDKIVEMFSSAKVSNPKTAIACLRFLLVNAARYNADSSTFGEELQQLGLPKEHSASLGKVHTENLPAIRRKLMEESLKVNELKSVTAEESPTAINCIELSLTINEPTNSAEKVLIHKRDAKVLLENLKEMREMMDKYDLEKNL
ncbi:COMMD4 family protein [Megaselia abdita]